MQDVIDKKSGILNIQNSHKQGISVVFSKPAGELGCRLRGLALYLQR